MDQMGAQAFQEIKSNVKSDADPRVIQYVNCVVTPLTQAAKNQTSVSQWEVVVFKSPDVNAFALPGGRIGVYSGLLNVAKSDAQLAAVVGHEIGHVIAHHGAERVSQQAGTQLGLAALGAISGNNPQSKTLMGLLGVGVQVGVLLPFSRTQENEADLVGLDLMARAGFDPHESVALWKNMIEASGNKAPAEWLSTHPASENRISNLESHMTDADAKYKLARSEGRTPKCQK